MRTKTTVFPFKSDMTNTWAYWDGAFTPEECKKIIEYAEKFEKTAGTVRVNNEVIPTIRDSNIRWIFSEPEIDWFYQRLADIITRLNENYFRFDLFGFMEGFQFTEYNAPNGHYDKHMDTMYNGVIRKLSFVLQLSDPEDYEGGELHLHLGCTPTIMKKEQGTVIVFSSHTLHEVTAVTKGKRYSLVGWVTGTPFK